MFCCTFGRRDALWPACMQEITRYFRRVRRGSGDRDSPPSDPITEGQALGGEAPDRDIPPAIRGVGIGGLAPRSLAARRSRIQRRRTVSRTRRAAARAGRALRLVSSGIGGHLGRAPLARDQGQLSARSPLPYLGGSVTERAH